MQTAILGDRSSILYFLALGLNVVFAEDCASCRSKLHALLKNGFKLVYITENYSSYLSEEVDGLQEKYDATIIFIPGNGTSSNFGTKMLEIYAERATGSTACLK